MTLSDGPASCWSCELTARLTDHRRRGINGVTWQWYRADDQNLASLPLRECDSTNTDNCLIKDAASAAYRPVAR